MDRGEKQARDLTTRMHRSAQQWHGAAVPIGPAVRAMMELSELNHRPNREFHGNVGLNH
jgi:hypothetical protein